MMDSWYQKLLDRNEQRDLKLAQNLDVDELRAWLRAHFKGDDPSAPHGPDTDPVDLLEDVWELVPGDELKKRLSEAILLEYQDCAKTPENCVDYFAYILRLMTHLPVADFPSRDIWRRYRSRKVAALSTADGTTLDSFLIQALFARGEVSLSEQKQLLKKRETANLAFKAIRDTGIGPAVAHLPDLLSALTEPVDDVALITHLKILVRKYSPKDLVEEIVSSPFEWNPEHLERLERLLGKLGIKMVEGTKENASMPRVALDWTDISKMMSTIFSTVGKPLAAQRLVKTRSCCVWDC